jgi:hypothetical protein
MKLREILKQKNIPYKVVTDALSVHSNNIGRYDDLSKRSVEDIVKISAVTGISISELIGDTFADIEKNAKVKPLDDIRYMNVPFIPVPAQAGYMAGYGDSEYIEELSTIPVIVDREYKGKYRVFEVKGDSMDDGSRNALYDGDKILCRDVRQDLWASKLHIRDWYFVIVSWTEGVIVKQIIEHDVETGHITYHSLNPIFEDRKINLRDVSELYNVIKIVDRNARI